MPLYDYICGTECLLALTLKEHETGAAVCPSCGSNDLEQLITSFIAEPARNVNRNFRIVVDQKYHEWPFHL